jgi:hypothetical protein
LALTGPGPPPWVQEAIAELTAVAAVLPDRELAGAIHAATAQVVERAYTGQQRQGEQRQG